MVASRDVASRESPADFTGLSRLPLTLVLRSRTAVRRTPREAIVPRKPRAALVVTSFGRCSACAQQGASVHSAAAVRDAAWRADVVTGPDLASGGDSRSVLEALQHARPSFLNAHGPPLAVVLDDSFITDISMLSTLSAADVCEIRLQRPPNAVATIRDGSDLPAEWSRVRLQLEWRRLIEAGGYAVPKTHPCFPDLVRAGLRQGG
jgi:hypothetical protein